jgi:hypothetical protein
VELLQNCAIRTRRIPKEEEIQRIRDERQQRVASGWKPTIDRQLLQKTDECEPFAQQHYQVTEFIRQAELAGRHEEAEILKLNLIELEKIMHIT